MPEISPDSEAPEQGHRPHERRRRRHHRHRDHKRRGRVQNLLIWTALAALLLVVLAIVKYFIDGGQSSFPQ